MPSVVSLLAGLLEVALCLLTADFISGLVHWAEDTWTVPGKNALLDRLIVVDNIDHHRRPGLIRAGHYWATNRVCIGGAVAVAAGLAACGVHAWQAYLVLLFSSQANQVHMYAHSADRPRLVRFLQSLGVLQSRSHHGRHHVSPYAVRYCAYTNYLNPVLDGTGFWRALERSIVRCGGTVQRGNAARGGY